MISSRKHRILSKTSSRQFDLQVSNLLKQFEHLAFAYSMSKIAMKHVCQKHQKKRQGL